MAHSNKQGIGVEVGNSGKTVRWRPKQRGGQGKKEEGILMIYKAESKRNHGRVEDRRN